MSEAGTTYEGSLLLTLEEISQLVAHSHNSSETLANICLLYTSPSPRDRQKSRMPSSA